MVNPKSIVFFHPDLGIGGAERLVIDAAVGLQSLGHKVTIFTSHCDQTHCFDEARDGTLDVRVRGNTVVPATFFGRFKILCAILRHYHLLLSIHVSGELTRLGPDAFFLDQLSAGIPLLRYFRPETRILFYCHFPDLLLVQRRQQMVRRLWRLPFDWVEGWSMEGADRVVVNSEFTRRVVDGVWGKSIGGEKGVRIVYPCVDTQEKKEPEILESLGDQKLWEGQKVVLSINRFEKKKDVGLAIRAFAGMTVSERSGVKLVIAGGYDNRVQENVSYLAELVSLSEDLGLQSATFRNIVTALSVPSDIDVVFLLSVTGQVKEMLLSAARLLIYTPSNEHFGIVPLEAMLAYVPVLAANSGGPLETVVDGETGWLRSVDKVQQWTEVMQQALIELPEERLQEMGKKGRDRVKAEFSETKMARTLDGELESMVRGPRASTFELQDLLLGLGVSGMLTIPLVGFVLNNWVFTGRVI